MDSKKIAVVLIALTLCLTSCGPESPIESSAPTEPTKIEQSPNEKTEESTEPSSEPQSWQFDVGGNDEDGYNDHEYEIPSDRVPVNSKVVQTYEGKDCLILYDVGDTKLNNYNTEKQIASYTYISGTHVYYLYVEVQSEQGDNAYRKMEAWMDAGADVLIESTPFGDAYFYKDVSEAATITYGSLKMKNGYYCTLKFTSDIDFDEAVKVMKEIYNEGITVVIPSESFSEDSGTT